MIDLNTLTDEEIFEISLSIEEAIESRIINLLKTKSISNHSFKNIESLPETQLCDAYGYSKNDNEWVKVAQVGYTTENVFEDIKDFVFIVDSESRFHTAEELVDLWDVYAQLKRELSE